MEIFGIVIVVAGALYIIYMVVNRFSGIFRIDKWNRIMERTGFTDRIVAYDFLSNYDKNWGQTGFRHWFYVGIWINYNKKAVCLRQEKDTWKPTIIPFREILDAEIIEDGYSKITGSALGYGGFAIGSAKVKEIIQGMQVRIVARNIRTEIYYLKLYDPSFGIKYDKTSSIYRSIEDCALAIVYKINELKAY